MNKQLLITIGAVALTYIAMAGTTHANNIYKCINEQGDVTYHDKPCPIGDDEENFKRLKDPKGNQKLPSREEKDELGSTTKSTDKGNKQTQRSKPLSSSSSTSSKTDTSASTSSSTVTSTSTSSTSTVAASSAPNNIAKEGTETTNTTSTLPPQLVTD